MCGWLCRKFLDRGLKPAVLSRGYKAGREGLADEMVMLSRQFPNAVVVAHPDRYKAGQLATDCYGVRAVILDDGFQHRRVGRDLDLLLVDATRPFGFGYVLPRGLLREPLKGLCRADAVVLTRCDQADAGQVARLEDEIRRLQTEVPVVRSVHRAGGFTGLCGEPVAAPQGSRIGTLAGIARPEAFERTLADIGIEPVDGQWWPDHHRYSAAEVSLVREWVNRSRLDAVLTTEKDAVKLAALNVDWPVPMIALHVEMEMLGDGERVLSGLIDEVLKEHAGPGQVAGNDDGDPDEKHPRD
jgi:tetraacyldisaccharide 4'-kinase